MHASDDPLPNREPRAAGDARSAGRAQSAGAPGARAGAAAERFGLTEAEGRLLANLTDQVPGVVYQYQLFPDGRSRFPYASRGIAEIYEVTPEEVREDAAPVLARLHPDDADSVVRWIRESAEAQSIFDREFRVVLPRQGLRWRHCHALPARQPDGSTVWHGVITDITARKEAETALRESEDRFRLLFEQAPDAMLIADPATGRVLQVNQAAGRLFGRPREELVGLQHTELHPPEMVEVSRGNFAQHVHEGMAGGDTKPIEHLAMRADGRQVPIEVLAHVIQVRGQRLILGTFRDLSERRQAEEALRLERLRSDRVAQMVAGLAERTTEVDAADLILNAAGDVLTWDCGWIGWWHEADGLLSNLVEYDLVDGRRERLATASLAVRRPSPLVERVIHGRGELLLRRDDSDQGDVLRLGGTGRRALSLMVVPIRHRGRLLGVMSLQSYRRNAYDGEALAFLQKVADQCASAVERIRAESALAETLREKEALLKEVHHRVKNNLQVISSLLRMEARRTGPPAAEVLQEINGRIRSMAVLHESLYRSGSFAAIELDTYLRQVTQHTFDAMAARQGQVHLEFELDAVTVEMDQAVPCGLLVNELISNCLKHGFPDGRQGEVRLSLRRIEGRPEVRLAVRDDGVGLPRDFDPQGTKTLGVHLAVDLARQLGGALAIEGGGGGAAFVLEFSPRVSGSAVAARFFSPGSTT